MASRNSASSSNPTSDLLTESLAWAQQPHVKASIQRGIQAVEQRSETDYVLGYCPPKAIERIMGFQNIEVVIDRRTRALRTKGGTLLISFQDLQDQVFAENPQKELAATPQPQLQMA